MEQVAIKEEIRIEKPRERKKRAVFVIAFRDFRDREYFISREILESEGVEIKTASTSKGIALGADGGEARVDFLINEANLSDFEGVIFIGGPGTLQYLDNKDSYKIIRETIEQNKILAAICISPVILAKSGVLDGKRATVWASSLDRKPIKILEENGAIYLEEKVVQDGRIITANGPLATEDFAKKILENL